MYHERGVRQVDIADTLHISQARVSRLLKRATELGIVRTVVAVAPGVLTEAEEALEDSYGIAEAVVVDVEGSDQDIIAALGSAGATYLETTLTGGDRIGISSWSQTLLAVVDRMTELHDQLCEIGFECGDAGCLQRLVEPDFLRGHDQQSCEQCRPLVQSAHPGSGMGC